MMKEPFPLSIGFRLTETFRVILKRFPRRKQKILVRRLHAGPDFNAEESGCSCDQWHRLSQRRFKFLGPAGYDLQYCVLDNQQVPPLYFDLLSEFPLLVDCARSCR
jgi:hypothetical protein